MFTQEQLLQKAAIAAEKGNHQVLRVMVDKILSEDITCIRAWEIYIQARGSARGPMFGKTWGAASWSRLALLVLRGLGRLRWLRPGFFLGMFGVLPHSSALRLILGEWALQRGAYALTVWAWEGLELDRPQKKLLVKIYSKLKLYDKAGALAQAVLKEEPYCTEMIDLLQASQFYQSMRPLNPIQTFNTGL